MIAALRVVRSASLMVNVAMVLKRELAIMETRGRFLFFLNKWWSGQVVEWSMIEGLEKYYRKG